MFVILVLLTFFFKEIFLYLWYVKKLEMVWIEKQ